MKILATAVGDTATAPQVTGFIESPFNPLVHQVAELLLSDVDASRVGIVLASELGDSVTTDLSSRLLTEGKPANALLFMQATANAILGYVSREFGITGPLIAMSALTDLGSALLDTAHVLLDDEELDRVVVVGVELAGSDRTAAFCRELGLEQPTEDFAVALLVDRDTSFEDSGGYDLRRLAEGPTP